MLLTILSENKHNVTSRIDGFDVTRILDYYTMPNDEKDVKGNTLNGTTIVVYDNSPSGYGQLSVLYGVSETAAYIAAGGEISANTTLSVKKTFGWSGATGVDFNLPATVSTTAYNMDLGNIVPANARVLDVYVRCKAASVFSGGATTLVAGLGNASAGTQFAGSATIYALNATVAPATGSAPAVNINSSASKVWVTDITPGVGFNWSTQTGGTYEVVVTYIDASGL